MQHCTALFPTTLARSHRSYRSYLPGRDDISALKYLVQEVGICRWYVRGVKYLQYLLPATSYLRKIDIWYAPVWMNLRIATDVGRVHLILYLPLFTTAQNMFFSIHYTRGARQKRQSDTTLLIRSKWLRIVEMTRQNEKWSKWGAVPGRLYENPFFSTLGLLGFGTPLLVWLSRRGTWSCPAATSSKTTSALLKASMSLTRSDDGVRDVLLERVWADDSMATVCRRNCE